MHAIPWPLLRFMWETQKGDEVNLKGYLRGDLKKNSIFKDIAQIGGGEVNPMSKN